MVCRLFHVANKRRFRSFNSLEQVDIDDCCKENADLLITRTVNDYKVNMTFKTASRSTIRSNNVCSNVCSNVYLVPLGSHVTLKRRSVSRKSTFTLVYDTETYTLT